MAGNPDSDPAALARALRLVRRGLYATAIAIGLLLGLVAGLFGLVVGGESTIVFTCLLAGAGVGWLFSKALIANRNRLMRVVGAWILGRLLPGSRTAKTLAALVAAGRAGAPGR